VTQYCNRLHKPGVIEIVWWDSGLANPVKFQKSGCYGVRRSIFASTLTGEQAVELMTSLGSCQSSAHKTQSLRRASKFLRKQISAPWKVEKNAGDLLELERDGELLEIARPLNPVARFIFESLRVGQIVHDPLVQLLPGQQNVIGNVD
jgi:hypothetical protein